MITFFDAWWHLQNHKLFKLTNSNVSFFDRGLDVNVVKVEPGTDAIDLEDDAKNTELQVWLEVATPEYEDDSYSGEWVLVNDIELNLHASGATFEEAVLNLYHYVSDVEAKQK